MKISRAVAPDVRQRTQAFTTAEIVVALAIMVVMFVSLYAGMSSGFAVTKVARENLRATQIMLERMEGIRLFSYLQLTNTDLNPLTFTNYYYPLAGPGESKGIPYYGTITITNTTLSPPATYSANMRTVTIGVQWESGGITRRRSMTTYSARDGVQNYIFAN
jgi:type II secretory pathway pseudopilin PulG